MILNLKKKKIEKLQERLERENGSLFFTCENKCMRLSFDQSTNFDFKCPECGLLMNQEDNIETIKKIKEEISILS